MATTATMESSWLIRQQDFSNQSTGKYESLFTLGNGFLGLRGDWELPGFESQRGSYINGFYEQGPITYGERAFGYAENWQTMVALPEGKVFSWEIAGAKLHKEGDLEIKQRQLNMQNGSLQWTFVWKHPNGTEVSGKIIRLVPFSCKGIAIISWELELPTTDTEIKLTHGLEVDYRSHGQKDPRLPEHFEGDTIDIAAKEIKDRLASLTINTTGSGLSLAAISDFHSEGVKWNQSTPTETARGVEWKLEGVTQSNTVKYTKVISYDYSTLADRQKSYHSAEQALHQALATPVDQHLSTQQEYLKAFWLNSGVETDSNPEILESLQFNLFQLLQSTGQDGKRSIAAKGLSGLGYEGHFFWDAETYVFPFFVYTNPSIARSMLQYRISCLEKARQRAETLGHKGVLFPWRTINGEEASAYYPAGTAQYHINADIALALVRYLEATGDKQILIDGGGELLMETARFWIDLGCWNEKGFCFHSVTGPDEYTAIVDNNTYTNMMARDNLNVACRFLSGEPELCKKLGVSTEELENWKHTATHIYLPMKEKVTPQDDSFMQKECWDFMGTAGSQYPLLLHFHPLNIYRKQVQKQADVVMAMVQNPNDFSPGLYQRNLDFYEETTTRDSSLSACAQGIAANRVGYEDLSWEYFEETLHTDRKDLHGNVDHGLHTASMGGSYLMIISGFLGLGFAGDVPCFRPRMPEHLPHLQLPLTLKGRQLRLTLTRENISFELIQGNPLTVNLFNESIELKSGCIITKSVKPELAVIVELVNSTDDKSVRNTEVSSLMRITVEYSDESRCSLEYKVFNGLRSAGILPEQVVLLCPDSNSYENLRSAFPAINLKNADIQEFSEQMLRDIHLQQITASRKFRGKRPKKVTHKGILFDLDGVITDTAEFHNRAWEKITGELGMEFTTALGDAVRGISRRESFLLILEANKRTMSDQDIDHWITVKNDYYRQSLVSEMDASHILPGVKPLLQELKDQGVACGLASASHNAPFILQKLGLDHYFQIIVDPGSVARGKPAPDIFVKGCEMLNLPPEQVVGVEDAVAGLQGMLEAGLYTIGVGQHPGMDIADRLLPDLSDYRKITEIYRG